MLTAAETVRRSVAARADGLIELRRDLHAHPETGWHEERTTGVVIRELAALGLQPLDLGLVTGAVAEIVGRPSGPVVALRADIDALPLQDTKDVAYRSCNPGAAHACGHDVHTAALVGAAGALADLARDGLLPGTVRLLFQPAEEVMPGGAKLLIARGALDGVTRAFALHCDPALDSGRIGLRAGPITAAVDHVEVHLSGPGGHTARPQLTVDLVAALADVISRVPALMSRRIDPRAGASLVWGHCRAGQAANVIPAEAVVAGTLRILDIGAWQSMPEVIPELIREVAAPYRAGVEVSYTPGVPPTVNDEIAVAELRRSVDSVLGPDASSPTPQSMGGEDFSWILAEAPGAMARLGVRRPGSAVSGELHRGDFDVDESAIADGAAVLAGAALAALDALA
jgi:amidohydrolase